MLGAAAQRIACPIRKPRNNADEAIAPNPGWDGACRAICCVAPLANGAYHWLRVASCISSRQASVAATRDLFRGSFKRRLDPMNDTALATTAAWSYGLALAGYLAFSLRIRLGWGGGARARLLLAAMLATALWAFGGLAIALWMSRGAWLISNL